MPHLRKSSDDLAGPLANAIEPVVITDDNAAALVPCNRSPEAQRALAEAAERRARHEAAAMGKVNEIGGRDGPDPVRYGDWEQGGIAWDF